MTTASVKHSAFTWKGQDHRGQLQKGEISGTNIALVKAQLRKQGIRNARVRKKSKALFGPAKPKIKAMDIAIFTRQLATMMKAGDRKSVG